MPEIPSSPPWAAADADPRQELRRWQLVLGAGLACLLPFLVKPPHTDDHVYLLVAQQIRQAPLDPFGLGINWFGWVQPLADAQMNPPGVSYVFAVAELVGGLPGLHLSIFACTALLLAGTRRLALDLGASPVMATAGALSTPAVFISSTTLMCDIPMVAAYVWCIVVWLRGLRDNDARWLAAAGLIGCVAFTMKYFAITLVPMCVWAAIAHRKPVRLWALAVLILPVFVVAYEAAMAARYGAPHFLRASGYANEMRRSTAGLATVIADFGYCGGAMPGLALWAPFILRRRGALVVATVTLLVAIVLARSGMYTWVALRGDDGFRWSLYVQALVQTAAMAAILISVCVAIARHWREPPTQVLTAWIAGTAVFAVAINWTLAVRSILPLVVPVAVLLARELGPQVRRLHLVALVPGAVFTLLGADGDARMANAQVEVAEHALTLAPADRLWFRGHWGFQTAMERGGATPLDVDESPVRAGDVIVWPSVNSGTSPDLSSALVSPMAAFEVPVGGFFKTLDGGGFYTIETGPWPVLVREVPPLQLRSFTVLQGRVE